jgi:hypothetical protein
MSAATLPEVTLEELSMETVELLPGRELMNCCCGSTSNNNFAIGLVNFQQSPIVIEVNGLL